MAAPAPPYGQPAAPPPGAYPPPGQAPPPGAYPPQGQAYPQQPPVVVVAAQPAFFGRNPMNMTCTNCRAQIQTAVTYETGTMVWLICLVLFFFTGFCCFIPFLIDGCKDAVHHCPSCRTFLGRKNAL